MPCTRSCYLYEAYIDVCDGTSYAARAKSFCNDAIAANVPAITTAGSCPGVSNVMAAELVRAVRDEGRGEPEILRFSYYIAGTRGAGPNSIVFKLLTFRRRGCCLQKRSN